MSPGRKSHSINRAQQPGKKQQKGFEGFIAWSSLGVGVPAQMLTPSDKNLPGTFLILTRYVTLNVTDKCISFFGTAFKNLLLKFVGVTSVSKIT